MKDEAKMKKKVSKNTPKIKWSRIESWSSYGIPDLLGYHDSCGFFMCELKMENKKKIAFSPHQILFHQVHQKRNFILLGLSCGAPRGPRKANEFKLYSSSSILGLLTDHRETPCLALDDWDHIERLLINAPLDA